MKIKLAGAAGLAGAFVAGMLVATALERRDGRGGGEDAGGGKRRGSKLIVQKVLSPTVSDEDIALLRKDIRAMKMQVIGQNMSLSEPSRGRSSGPSTNTTRTTCMK